MADKVTKEQVYTIVGKELSGDIPEIIFNLMGKRSISEIREHTGHIDGIFNSWGENEKIWVVSIVKKETFIGSSHIIVISKKSGEILFSGMVGE
jgi:hypothetical protein